MPDELARARIHKMSLPPEIAQVDQIFSAFTRSLRQAPVGFEQAAVCVTTGEIPGSRDDCLETEWRAARQVLSPLTRTTLQRLSQILAFLFPTLLRPSFKAASYRRHPSPARCWSGRQGYAVLGNLQKPQPSKTSQRSGSFSFSLGSFQGKTGAAKAPGRVCLALKTLLLRLSTMERHNRAKLSWYPPGHVQAADEGGELTSLFAVVHTLSCSLRD